MKTLARVVLAAATTTIVVAAAAVVAWFAYSALTGATLITFRTGSMSPTIPQGSVAVALPVTASEVQLGDVLTVQRSDEELPVTHRVLEIRTAEHASTEGLPEDAREIIMHGDGNDTPDMKPYVITEARRVVLSQPGLGTALMLLQSPLGMGVLTVLAGAFTVWAFWPKPRSGGEGGEPNADT